MSLSNLIPQQPANVIQSEDVESPMVMVVVEYYKGGRMSVRCNADGEKVNEMIVQLLEGAIRTVQEGVGVQTQ